MNLIVDASVLVGEVLRARGLVLLSSPALTFFQPEHAAGETRHELRRRGLGMVQAGRATSEQVDALLNNALAFFDAQVIYVPATEYQTREVEVRKQIPRDPNDWPLFALALQLGQAPVLTLDGDFLGCGLPTWTPETLRLHLGR